MDKIEKILKKVDNGFVENYNQMNIYKEKVNEILSQMNIKEFKDYNTFCISIKDNIKNELLMNENVVVNNRFVSYIINKTIRDKIRKDKNNKEKLDTFFNINNSEDLLKFEHYKNNI